MRTDTMDDMDGCERNNTQTRSRARVLRPMRPSRCGRTNGGGLELLHAQRMCWPYIALE